jgi:hypothetical protein
MEEYKKILDTHKKFNRKLMDDENYQLFLDGKVAKYDSELVYDYYSRLVELDLPESLFSNKGRSIQLLLATIVKNHLETENMLPRTQLLSFRELCNLLGYFKLANDLI